MFVPLPTDVGESRVYVRWMHNGVLYGEVFATLGDFALWIGKHPEVRTVSVLYWFCDGNSRPGISHYLDNVTSDDTGMRVCFSVEGAPASIVVQSLSEAVLVRMERCGNRPLASGAKATADASNQLLAA